MRRTRVVIELGKIAKPLDQTVEDAMRLDPDEIEIVGDFASNDDLEIVQERVQSTGHVLLTGDIRRPTDGVNVIVLA